MVTDYTSNPPPSAHVKTPHTSFASYDLAWRHLLVTRAMAEDSYTTRYRLPAAHRSDPAVIRHAAFLERLTKFQATHADIGTGEFLDRNPRYAEEYHAWQLSQFSPDVELHTTHGALLDAMLLTEAPLETISAATQIPMPVLRTYEALYFNVRELGGVMKMPPARRVSAALGGDTMLRPGTSKSVVMRYIGALVGFQGLLVYAGISDTAGGDVIAATRNLLMRTLMQQLVVRVVSGDAKLMDMSSMLETLLKDEREQEANVVNASNTATAQREMLTTLLGMLRPKVAAIQSDAAAAEALASYIGTSTSPAAAGDDPFFEVDQHISRRLGQTAEQLTKGTSS